MNKEKMVTVGTCAPIKPALIPETVGLDIARTILPAILRDYADPEIQADFQRWKAERASRHKGESDRTEDTAKS